MNYLDLDAEACRRLAVKVLVLTMRDIRSGSPEAESWLKNSSLARACLSELDLDHVDVTRVISVIKSEQVRLTARGSRPQSDKLAIQPD